MPLTKEQAKGVSKALDEATWSGLRLFQEQKFIVLTFSVLSLPEDGPELEDSARALVLKGVSRFVASHRNGNWDDEDAGVETHAESDLSDVVRSFGACPIYGADFIDPDEVMEDRIKGRFSTVAEWSTPLAPHCARFFKEYGSEQYLELWIWFADLHFQTIGGEKLDLEEVIAGARRWWASLNAGDGRTRDHGIYIPATDDFPGVKLDD